MKLFNQVLVAYDMGDTRKRTRLFETMKDFGLIPVQKSVMWGYVNGAEERAIRRELKRVLAKGDRGFLLRVGDAARQIQEEGVGYSDMKLSRVDEPSVL